MRRGNFLRTEGLLSPIPPEADATIDGATDTRAEDHCFLECSKNSLEDLRRERLFMYEIN